MIITGTPIDGMAGSQLHVRDERGPLSPRDFLSALEHDVDAADELTRVLAALPHTAFAWECRAFSASTLDEAMQMVAVDSPALAQITADPEPFAAQLTASAGTDGVV